MKPSRSFAAIVAATLTAASWCGHAFANDPALAAEQAAALANRYVQPTLSFKPCAENPGLDCASLKVPKTFPIRLP